MGRISIPQQLILFAFFLLINSSIAIPSSRAHRVLQCALDVQGSGDVTEIKDDEVLSGRMNIDSNDYPGSVANNRHTPKPTGKKIEVIR